MAPPPWMPAVAIVIPVFRHPQLVGDAIEAALAQVAPFDICIVIVNDGCPQIETDMVCREYATAYPDRIRYVRKQNGGLSSARNAGIRYVMAHLPSVEALYFLDADNRLRPQAMAKAKALLDKTPGAGWVYPSLDMFGLEWSGDMGGDYSLLIHADTNICEAGSLVHRSVFETGLLFDEEFKLGWEDWDFFLSAAERGFFGVNCEDFGFLYRKRPESMLANSERDNATIRSMMYGKHQALMHPKRLAELEQAECPRFAILLTDRQEVIWTLDPSTAPHSSLTWAEHEKRLALHAVNPNRHFAPPFTILATSATIERLRRAGLLHWTLWRMERALQSCQHVAVCLKRSGQARVSIQNREHGGRKAGQVADLFCTMTKTLADLVRSDAPSIMPERDPAVSLWSTDISLPDEGGDLPAGPDMFAAFTAMTNDLQTSCRNDSWNLDWEWRLQTVTPRPHTQLIARNMFLGAPSFPHVQGRGCNIGFVLPLVEFGGVEKVALNMARGLRAHGWRPHLFVVSASDIRMSTEWNETFETISFLDDPDFHIWDENPKQYYGTSVPHWAIDGAHGVAQALFHWLDAIICFHAGAMLGVLGQLRRLGIRTVTSLHVSDQTPTARPKGNTHLAIAFEHAIDIFAPCSHLLADWCHGLGIPATKIVTVQNVSGNDEDAGRLRDICEQRRNRPSISPLRILFLGRFDVQKGIDHLARIHRAASQHGLNVEWRIIGKPVIGSNVHPAATDLLDIAEPPLESHVELTQAYAWADIMLLPSLYEGLPLTILEAMRAGVVPIVTDVGAVREIICDGVSGFIVPLDDVERRSLSLIERLANDRELLHSIGKQAFSDRAGHDWQHATAPLSEKLLQ